MGCKGIIGVDLCAGILGMLIGASILGMLIGASVLGSMAIGDQAIDKLRNIADEHFPVADRVPVVGLRREDLKSWENGLVPWLILPWSLVAIWPVLILVRWLVS